MKTTTNKRDHNKLRVFLGWVVACSGALGLYMSWGALYELAIAYALPLERAFVFPLIIDIPAVTALIIGMVIVDSRGWARALPWVVLVIFGTATVLGNAEVVSRIPLEDLAGPVWIAVLVHSAPAIAAMTMGHLAVETVYRHDRWTDRPSRASTKSPVVKSTDSPRPPRETPAKSTGPVAEKRERVESLLSEGLTPAEVVLQTGYPKSSVYKWAGEHARNGRVSA